MRTLFAKRRGTLAAFVFAAAISLLIALSQQAWADVNYTYNAANGWKLNCEVGSTVTISSVAEEGNGQLTIPATVNGKSVTAIGDRCFEERSALESIVLPDTLIDLGRNCFHKTALKSFTLPKNVKYIPAYCFWECADLKSIDIRPAELQYISANAFDGCSSLETLQIPTLTGHVPYSDKGNIAKDFPLGNYCFWGCTSLKIIEFLGSVGDDIEYFSDVACLEGCDNLEALVYHTKKSAIPKGMGSTDTVAKEFYFSLDFYKTEQDAEKGVNRIQSVTYSWDVGIMDILSGKADPKKSWNGQSQIPSAPAGKVWGAMGNAIKGPSTKLTNSLKVVACDPNDLNYGYVCSPVIQDFLEKGSTTTTMNSQNYPAYYLDANGDALGFDEIFAYGPDGKKLDPSLYDLVYQEGLYSKPDWTWTETQAPLKKTGTYKVKAKGKGSSASQTDDVTFTLSYFSPQVSTYGGETIKYLGSVSADAMSMSGTKSLYSVVVPEDDWRYQLIGAGLAGIGKANILFDGKQNWDTETVRAFAQASATSVQIIGSKSKVPESDDPSKEACLVDLLKERELRYLSRYSDDATIQALARSVYTSIRDQHSPNGADAWEAGWGDAAIVVPSSLDVSVLPVAQLAYMLGAPIFFTEADGSLDPKTLKYFISDGFEKVYLAGDASLIPEKTASQIETLAFVETERILVGNSTSGEICADFANRIAGILDSPVSGVVIASTDRDSNVVAGAQLAALTGNCLLTCSSEADSKAIQAKIQDWMDKNGFLSVSQILYVGNFSSIDGSIASRISSIWKSPLSTQPSIGDSREVGDFVYRLNANGTASLLRVRNSSLESATVGSIIYGGKAYSVTSVAAIDGPNIKKATLGSNVSYVSAGAFSKASSLQTLTVAHVNSSMLSNGAFRNIGALTTLTLTSKDLKTLPANSFSGCSNLLNMTLSLSSLSTISKGAFNGCANLKKLKLTSSKLASLPSSVFSGKSKMTSISFSTPNLKTIGSKAFYGCKVLASITIGKKVTNIGSSAFQGCAALKKIVIPSKVKTIGSKAFYGCKKLTSVTMGAAVTSIGTYAFQGCTALSKLTVPAKVKTIGSNAFKGAKKLKTLTVKSTKLTKKTVKKSLTGSSVTKVKVSASAKKATNKKYIAKYKKYFTKANCGKKVSVK